MEKLKWSINGPFWSCLLGREENCGECDQSTAQPLAHYLIECPVTGPFFGEIMNLEGIDARKLAAQRVRNACHKINELAQHTRRYPPRC